MDKEILRQLKDAETLYEQSEDREIKDLAREEILELRRQVDLGQDENQRNAVLEIRAGSGGALVSSNAAVPRKVCTPRCWAVAHGAAAATASRPPFCPQHGNSCDGPARAAAIQDQDDR